MHFTRNCLYKVDAMKCPDQLLHTSTLETPTRPQSSNSIIPHTPKFELNNTATCDYRHAYLSGKQWAQKEFN